MRLPFISASVGVCSLSSPLFFFFLLGLFLFFPLHFYPGKSCPAQRFAISRRYKTIRWSLSSYLVWCTWWEKKKKKKASAKRTERYIRTYTWSTVYISVDHHWQCIVLRKWQEKKAPIYCVVYQPGKEKGNWLQLVIYNRWLNIFFCFDSMIQLVMIIIWYKYDTMVLVRKWHRRQMFSIDTFFSLSRSR